MASINHDAWWPKGSLSINEIAFAPASVLARRIREGALTSAQLVQQVLDRIAALDSTLGAFVAVYADEALRAAARADNAIRLGVPLGPLHGIPVGLKDCIDLKDRVTTAGSMVWRSQSAESTAPLVTKLERSGMIILGKTSMVEFSMGGWGTNRLMGTPWNPWDMKRHRTPGGSSSGSAVAVAAGMVPTSIGADTGGSVRIPAAWCGIVGLKPSVGRVNTSGLVPLARTFDSPGPMARYVEDVALLYGLLVDSSTGGERGAVSATNGVLSGLRDGVAGLRLATLTHDELEPLQPDVLANFDRSLAQFESLGSEIVEVSLPYSLESMSDMAGTIITYEAYSTLSGIIEDAELPINDSVRENIMRGRDVSEESYRSTLASRDEISHGINNALRGTAALLTPTTATVAVPLDEVDEASSASRLTRFVNLIDGCALALPNGIAEGLPTSLQIICPRCSEDMIFRVGWAYESLTRQTFPFDREGRI